MTKCQGGIAIPHKFVVLLALSCSALISPLESGAFRLFVQDIKTSLSLSDTELGLLTGFALFATYALVGIPLARRADRGNRVLVVAGCAALASVMMFLYGAVANFWQLVLVRMGVGIGEAGTVPASLTLISSSFRREERPRAFSLYGLAVPIGGAIGLFISGWAGQYYGWRVTFMTLGVLGLGFAFLTWLLLNGGRENLPPVTVASTCVDVPTVASPRFWRAVGLLFRIPTYRNIILSSSVMAFFSAGILTWITPYFIRSFHLSVGVLGTWFAIGSMTIMAGLPAGGYLATRFAPGNESLHLKINAVLYVVSCAFLTMILLTKSPLVALMLYVGNNFVLSLSYAPVQSAYLTAVPENLRSLSAAIMSFFACIIGAGLGPLIAGSLSDLFHPWAGDQSLRYALLVLCPGYLWSSYHMWTASRSIAKDLKATIEAEPRPKQQIVAA